MKRDLAITIDIIYIGVFIFVLTPLCGNTHIPPKIATILPWIWLFFAFGWFACIIVCHKLSRKDREMIKQKNKELKEIAKQRRIELYTQKHQLSPEEIEIRAKKVEEKLREMERLEKLKRQEQEQKIKDSTPISSTLMFTTPKLKTYARWFGIGRPVYQITTNYEATFRVEYASGRIGIETVSTKSTRYRELMAIATNR